jgi:hypothetical protein
MAHFLYLWDSESIQERERKTWEFPLYLITGFWLPLPLLTSLWFLYTFWLISLYKCIDSLLPLYKNFRQLSSLNKLFLGSIFLSLSLNPSRRDRSIIIVIRQAARMPLFGRPAKMWTFIPLAHHWHSVQAKSASLVHMWRAWFAPRDPNDPETNTNASAWHTRQNSLHTPRPGVCLQEVGSLEESAWWSGFTKKRGVLTAAMVTSACKCTHSRPAYTRTESPRAVIALGT